MKLHVGCGEKIFSGWTNLDIDDLPGVDIIDDARKLSKIPDFSPKMTGFLQKNYQRPKIENFSRLQTWVFAHKKHLLTGVCQVSRMTD